MMSTRGLYETTEFTSAFELSHQLSAYVFKDEKLKVKIWHSQSFMVVALLSSLSCPQVPVVKLGNIYPSYFDLNLFAVYQDNSPAVI